MAGATRQNQSSVELFAIYEVSKILSSSLDLQQTLREVLRLLSYHLQMQRGRICLLTDDSTLKLIAALGMSQEEFSRRFKSSPVKRAKRRGATFAVTTPSSGYSKRHHHW